MHVVPKYRTNPPAPQPEMAAHEEFCRRLNGQLADQFKQPIIFAMLLQLGEDGVVDPSKGSGVTPIAGQPQVQVPIVVLDYVTEAARGLQFAPAGVPRELRVELQISSLPG